jgi:hypothetical protein
MAQLELGSDAPRSCAEGVAVRCRTGASMSKGGTNIHTRSINLQVIGDMER